MRTRRSRSSSNPVPSQHRSVLLHEALEALDIHESDTVVDATLGGAGHAREIVKKLGRGGFFVGFDLDSDAIDRAMSEGILSPEGRMDSSASKIELINANFADLLKELEQREIKSIDKALFDLGWSSDQLDSGRGFSFLKNEPLQMTYRKDADKQLITAKTIVNEWEESSIADIIYGWGEERYSRRIAKAIVEYRATKPIETSSELAEIIKRAVPAVYARGRIHPATRTFQALRIAVNDEFGAIQKGIRSAWQLLKPGGRIAVITFHSIEDRAVKQLFVELEQKGGGRRITKKPIVPTDAEISENPRARSAKLRVIQKN
ncbi:16S rRNA (cytosine(1402)-N(4))-methyltransferase RsmH [Candidatus Parcubacteria bacterium]|nr:MAG: 16S rRNA (cytosine(1402)-N(4))-methyltransferase RsmH [Candidatus Parcubacteria bacterium]